MAYFALLFIFSAILACPGPTLSQGSIQRDRRSTQANSPAECSNPTQWFTQSVDHNGRNNGTFQQKYYVSVEHYRPGGPILLFQGDEATPLYCLEKTIFHDFVRNLNGIGVALEHRYFGESVPFGADLANYTPQQWSYLTLDNVMDDAVQFVQSLKSNVTGANNATVFAASGSYGGFLMTMFRQNRPETFAGVIASSPPIRAFFGDNETTVPDQFNWWNYVSTLYRDSSKEAADKIQEAFHVLKERFTYNNISSLQADLGLCEPLLDNSTQTLGELVVYLQQVFSNAAEFNYNIVRPGWNPFAWPLYKMINITLEQSDPIQVLNKTSWGWNAPFAASTNLDYPCLNQSDFVQLSKLAGPIETAPFSYITCTYVQFAMRVDQNTIFLPTADPGAENRAIASFCSAPPSEKLYTDYHFTSQDLQNSTGIIFSVGRNDPTTSLSGEYSFAMPLRGDVYASQRIVTQGMAHREDLFSQDGFTKETVRQTNALELEIFKQWMG